MQWVQLVDHVHVVWVMEHHIGCQLAAVLDAAGAQPPLVRSSAHAVKHVYIGQAIWRYSIQREVHSLVLMEGLASSHAACATDGTADQSSKEKLATVLEAAKVCLDLAPRPNLIESMHGFFRCCCCRNCCCSLLLCACRTRPAGCVGLSSFRLGCWLGCCCLCSSKSPGF